MLDNDFRANDPAELYIELLKRSLTNYLGLENGLRISYLLMCMDTSVAYDIHHVKEIAQYEPDTLAALTTDLDAKDNYRERILGFPMTMIGRRRLDNLEHCVRTVLKEGVPGDFLEAGVWRGGSVIFMRGLLKVFGHLDRKVWVADSFQGVPPPSLPQDQGIDLYQDIWLSVSREVVEENFARYGLLDDQVRFLPGWFKDTLPDAPVERLSVLRLDGDLYESTMDVLTAMYDRVSPGGFIIIDDYHAYEVCGQAVRDFLDERGIEVEMHGIDWTGVYWRKA